MAPLLQLQSLHETRRLASKKQSSIWTSTFQNESISPNEDLFQARSAAIEVAHQYRVGYYARISPRYSQVAWNGACWCSDAAIGAFPYGPGPGDPYLPASLIQAFFSYHERALERFHPVRRLLPCPIEDDLNRRCFVLALFEMIVRMGLDDSHDSPLFRNNCHRVADLLGLASEKELELLRQKSYSYFQRCINPVTERSEAAEHFDSSPATALHLAR